MQRTAARERQDKKDADRAFKEEQRRREVQAAEDAAALVQEKRDEKRRKNKAENDKYANSAYGKKQTEDRARQMREAMKADMRGGRKSGLSGRLHFGFQRQMT